VRPITAGIRGIFIHAIVSQLDLCGKPAAVCGLDDRVDLQSLVVAIETHLSAVRLGVDAEVVNRLRLEEEAPAAQGSGALLDAAPACCARTHLSEEPLGDSI